MNPVKPILPIALCAVVAAGVATSAPGQASAGTSPNLTELDGALARGRESTGAPAATGAVMRCGQLLWSAASGVMDLDSQRPATPRTLFATASAGKPITAALVLDLVERRRLSLTTRLSRFYPRLPKARKITVRMLLNHTSGLSEYFDDPRVAKILSEQPAHRWKRSEVLRGITRSQFAPGTRHVYTNSNYVVLGGIVEKVSRTPVERVFRTRIADRLRLSDSTMEYRPDRSELFAHPYVSSQGGLRDAFVPGLGLSADYWGPVWTDGGLASTAPDIARFGDALFEGRLLRPRTVRTMTRVNASGYGLGIQSKRFAGRTWLGHNGAYFGYGAEVWNDTSRRLTVVVLSNSDGSSTPIWQQLVTAYDGLTAESSPCPAG
jgi:D-alanyl-D-alanine carboxypeptidase